MPDNLMAEDTRQMESRNYQVFIGTPHTSRDKRRDLSWLIFLVKNGRNTHDIPLLPRRKTKVMRAYDNQTEIGWQHFMRVRMM
jgi:hypothetical protein